MQRTPSAAAVRPSAVAGTFYPADAEPLRGAVRGYLRNLDPDAATAIQGLTSPPKALIAPHAGYRYSGPITGSAYAALSPQQREHVRRVVLVGPPHRVAFPGLATVSHRAFATPLGEVPVDRKAVAVLLQQCGVRELDAAHRDEHGLEVHLPFLQVLLHQPFTLIPLLFGDTDDDATARALEAVWGDQETLVVISSDLSHFLSYDDARSADDATADAIARCDTATIGPHQACGHLAVRAALHLAQGRGLTVTRLDLRNSGDTAGPRDRVVGYGSWAFG